MPILSFKSQNVCWDIGSYSVKVVVFSGSGENIQIEKAIEVANPTGVSFPTQKLQLSQLQGLIASIISEHKIPTSGVRFSLSENIVSTQLIEMPNLSDAELASAITWQAEQYLPIPKEELVSEYQVLSRPDPKMSTGQKMQVLLVGTRKMIIEQTVAMFRANGIELELLENQTVSLARQLSLPAEAPNTMLIQIGASLMTILVLRRGQPFFVLNYPEAGDLLTKALMNNFSISKDKAEEYKKAFGLLADQGEGKIAAALQPVIDLIIGNIRNAISFFSTKNDQEKIERLLVAGGSAQLPGLASYLQNTFNLETSLVDNFAGFKGNIPTQDQPAYSVALGLAKRQL